MAGATLEEARLAKAEARAQLAGLPKVCGVGIGTSGDGYVVKINLAELPRDGTLMPERVAGVPVVYEVVGTITPR
ncbi:MAG: hypothetical protein K2X11_10710 [Acetobacteraceae bacterium]|nr:hypothetical protein [Acetobacteraceae bacterium]